MYWTFENDHNCFSAIHSIVQFLKLRDPKIMSKFLNQACAGHWGPPGAHLVYLKLFCLVSRYACLFVCVRPHAINVKEI